MLLQYQFHPAVNPEFNSSYFQKVSHDDGHTWSEARVVTDLLKGCNPIAPNYMQVETAGAKIMTSSGRIIFAGHGGAGGTGCRWWTDDGGDTYKTSSLYPANEVSFAEVAPNVIYMNGRAGKNPWNPHRTAWTSRNDGTNFSEPYECPLKDDDNHGFSVGLVALPVPGGIENRTLFLSEPQGPHRVGLRVHCSRDGGSTWPWSTLLGAANDRAAYSSMVAINHSTQLLVVWESLDEENKQNWKYVTIGTEWCGPGPG